MIRLVYGVGINDADYVVTHREHFYVAGKRYAKNTWECPFYSKWTRMLYRCYHKTFKEKHTTYEGCYVTEEWLTFSNFKSWMETQNWKGLELDKDILVFNNKVYSPNTCIFVSQRVNKFLNIKKAMENKNPTGVVWNEVRGKYRAKCSDPFTGKVKILGEYSDIHKAHNAWFEFKLNVAYKLIEDEGLPSPVGSAIIERVREMQSVS